jgi:hypothetical protein
MYLENIMLSLKKKKSDTRDHILKSGTHLHPSTQEAEAGRSQVPDQS